MNNSKSDIKEKDHVSWWVPLSILVFFPFGIWFYDRYTKNHSFTIIKILVLSLIGLSLLFYPKVSITKLLMTGSYMIILFSLNIVALAYHFPRHLSGKKHSIDMTEKMFTIIAMSFPILFFWNLFIFLGLLISLSSGLSTAVGLVSGSVTFIFLLLLNFVENKNFYRLKTELIFTGAKRKLLYVANLLLIIFIFISLYSVWRVFGLFVDKFN